MQVCCRAAGALSAELLLLATGPMQSEAARFYILPMSS